MERTVNPRGCTSLKLRQLSRVVTRHYDSYVAATGLKNSQYSLLSHALMLGPVRPSELALRMGLQPSTLTRNLRPLVSQGLLRLGLGADARSRVVEVTAAGRAKRAEAKLAWKHAQVSLNGRLGVARTAALHELIDECMMQLGSDAAAID